MTSQLKTTLITTLILLAVHSYCDADPRQNPVVTGPITGGKQGKPFSAPTLDLAEYGYRMAEYFIEGKASGFEFKPGTEKTPDGRWQVRSKGEEIPYKTRILVVRPIEQDDFNGTVVLHWQNVTAGYELGSVGSGEYLRGYTWVGVSAQKIGVDGVPGPTAAGLRQWDPERYGSLVHPGDAYSYDMYTQAARVVAADRTKRSNDPMAGLQVEREISGSSHVTVPRVLPGSEASLQTGLENPNWHSYTSAYDAALRHMHIWLKDGTPPQIAERINVIQDNGPRIKTDKYGNALGGIRLPDFAVPIAEHRGRGTRTPGGNRFSFLYGFARDFTSEELKARYKNEKAFKAEYEQAIDVSIAEGVMLEEDAALMRDRAFRWIKGRL